MENIIHEEIKRYIATRKIMHSVEVVDEVIPNTLPPKAVETLMVTLEREWQRAIVHVLNTLLDMPQTGFLGNNVGQFIHDRGFREAVLGDLAQRGNIYTPIECFRTSLDSPVATQVEILNGRVEYPSDMPEGKFYAALDEAALAYAANRYLSLSEKMIEEVNPDGEVIESFRLIKRRMEKYLTAVAGNVMSELMALESTASLGGNIDLFKTDKTYRAKIIVALSREGEPSGKVLSSLLGGKNA